MATDQLYPGVTPTLPLQYNIEGIFYNKKLFAQNGINVPQSWEELVAAANKRAQATDSIQPGVPGRRDRTPGSQ